MYLPVAIANTFWDIARSAGRSVDPMKIQKLVYFAHGWHLGLEKGPLSSEHAEAWRWGPVFPDLYHSVKKWGRDPIDEPIITFVDVQWTAPQLSPADEFALQLTNRVWEVYGGDVGVSVVSTHA